MGWRIFLGGLEMNKKLNMLKEKIEIKKIRPEMTQCRVIQVNENIKKANATLRKKNEKDDL
jgi:hypothetical protein